jgi:glutaredoxin
MKVLKTPLEITLYGRAMCSWCEDAKAWLNEAGWKYALCDTGRDTEARKRAAELSGQNCVPVIVVDGKVLGDFDTGQLEAFLKERGYLA